MQSVFNIHKPKKSSESTNETLGVGRGRI